MASNIKDAKNEQEEPIWETVKVVIQALLIAFVIRIFFFQPFNIPSESMVPTLRVGDYLFVNKLSYGYGKYSFNFSVGFFGKELFGVDSVPMKGRVLKLGQPKRGDVLVFKLPYDNKTDYIKRLIGLPGDEIQMLEGVLYINGKAVKRTRIEDFINTYGDGVEDNSPRVQLKIPQYRETLPNGVSYITHDKWPAPSDNTMVFKVPAGNYFMLGDNRDNSQDSRYPKGPSGVGFVPYENLVGRATFIFFSHTQDASLLKFWTWPTETRWNRIFKWIQG